MRAAKVTWQLPMVVLARSGHGAMCQQWHSEKGRGGEERPWGQEGSRECSRSYPLGAGWAERSHGVAEAGAMRRYSRCLEVDDGDDTRAPSVS